MNISKHFILKHSFIHGINVLFFNSLRIKLIILVKLLATKLSFHRQGKITDNCFLRALSIGCLISDKPLSCDSISKNRNRAHMN